MSPSSTARAELFAALVDLDDLGAVRLLDEHREREGLSSLVGDLVLPVMKEIGVGWEHGKVSVAREHLSTQVVRAYLDGLRRPPVVGGRQAFLACPPLELHDLPLLALALLLWDQGWQVRFFGANTPLHDLLRMVRVARPDLVVVSGDDPDRMSASAVALDLLAAETDLALGGRAAQTVGHTLSGRVLPPDVVLAAEELRDGFAAARTG